MINDSTIERLHLEELELLLDRALEVCVSETVWQIVDEIDRRLGLDEMVI